MQHLLVETSSLKNLEDSDFQYNGAKKRFSHSYGFGLVNADKMVTLAEKWPTIGEQHVCVKEKEVLYPYVRFLETKFLFEFSFNSSYFLPRGPFNHFLFTRGLR